MNIFEENIISNCLEYFILVSEKNKIFCFNKKTKNSHSIIYVFKKNQLALEVKKLLLDLKFQSFESFFVVKIIDSSFLMKKQNIKCFVFDNIENFKQWINK